MKGATEQTKVHYKGEETQEDFIVFVDDVDEYETYVKGLKDKNVSKPALSHFISSFKIFITHKSVFPRSNQLYCYSYASTRALESARRKTDQHTIVKQARRPRQAGCRLQAGAGERVWHLHR